MYFLLYILFIAHIDPLPATASDTLDTLTWASKCREIQMGPTKRDVEYETGVHMHSGK